MGKIWFMMVIAMLLPVLMIAQTETSVSQIRHSPVAYHMSFDNRDFFEQDFIEQSGKKSIGERKIDFPEGKFGNGIRMSYIPEPPDANNMTGIDLDLVTAVVFNTHPGNEMGYNQPFIWGSGRLNPRLGSVAFWAKGSPTFSGPLFEQTSISFGRTERDLLGVILGEDNKLEAYVRDARYVRHELKTDVIWDDSGWNHIVMNWDWAEGMELWLNGKKIASSWGKDGWFETAPPGLFHLPVPGFSYDELYLMDRPLTEAEIIGLIDTNTPPGLSDVVYKRPSYDSDRLEEYSGTGKNGDMPVASPEHPLSFLEVWPENASDGHIPGWYAIDGRNEMAWPHPYAIFTIIPGDGDFHAEKLDIQTPAESQVNYVALTGNLTNVKVKAGKGGMQHSEEIFEVPSKSGFFYSRSIPTREGATFRIPFTESYGTPPGFNGDLNLPLSGEKRLHNVGLYHVTITESQNSSPKGEQLVIGMPDFSLEGRTRFAIEALTSRDERKIALASTEIRGKLGRQVVNIGAFSRLNIMGEPSRETKGLKGMTLSLPLKTKRTEETLYIRVRDPAVPSRLWNQFAVKLKGFDKGYKKLLLTLDFQDMVLTGNDRFWLDIGTAGETLIKMGDRNNPAELFLEPIETYRAVDAYSVKEMISAQAQYSKQYEFMPWQFTGRKVSLEAPYSYGGPFDMIMPALAVKRVNPDYFPANFMIEMSGEDYRNGHRIAPEQTELAHLENPFNAPEWALYMRDYKIKRWAIADWWTERQNPDGQVGGGWNDDTLFGTMGFEDLLQDGHKGLLELINNIQTKFEVTRLFKDGYCNIYPMDRMHTGDFIGERYKTLVHNLGMVHPFERELEAAWRLDKPEETPVNYYADGFRSSANVFHWYWGTDMPENPYISRPLNEVAEKLRLYTSVLDDFYFYRMTESNVMRDDFVPFGSGNWNSKEDIYTYTLGGLRGARLDAHVGLAVGWPSGGGPEVSRVVLNADDVSLKVAIYSFDDELRDLKMRLFRINEGKYRIGIYSDTEGDGRVGKPLWTTEKNLSRFDVVSLPIPPKEAVVLVVEQLEEYDRPKELPDFALDPEGVIYKNGEVRATVHNLGNAAAKNISVGLLDGDKLLQIKVIEQINPPIDFVAKKVEIVFDNIPVSRNLKMIVDYENKHREILKENNRADVLFEE